MQNHNSATDATQDQDNETAELQNPGAEDAAAGSDGEFRVTIRKLELPVRPRGVLAE